MATEEGTSTSTVSAGVLTAAERARVERNRQRARALRDANMQRAAIGTTTRAVTTHTGGGGGFMPDDDDDDVTQCQRRYHTAPAPLQPPDRPPCIVCGERIATSYLLDTFGYAACDACRDEDGAHALLTRTEAKTEFLLKDCDLDARGDGPLACLRRPNPHARGRSDMRLYLRAQVEERALLVWGSEARLEAERAARESRREVSTRRRGARAVRALRMQVRSSLYAVSRPTHEHRWGPETYIAASDEYERVCLDCDHVETYEKM